MNYTLVAAAAEPAAVVQTELGDLTTGVLVVVVALMGLSLAWMLTSAWKGGGTPRTVERSDRLERVDRGPDLWSEIGEELDRSRRFHRDFSLIRIGTPSGAQKRASGDVQVISSALRSIDRAWAVDDAYLIMLPESTREQAEALVERIRVHPLLDLSDASITIASFPGDGVTSGALLSALRGGLVVTDRQAAGAGTPADAGERQREQPHGELAR